MASLLAGLLGGLGQGGGLTGKFIDNGFDTFNKQMQNRNAFNISQARNENLLELQKLIGSQKQQINDSQLKQQRDIIDTSRNDYKNAGLPEFLTWGGGGRGGIDVGRTSSYVGGNNFVNSFGGPNTNLPTSGSSIYADLNGLSRPNQSNFGSGFM